jgi:hypothetical protein
MIQEDSWYEQLNPNIRELVRFLHENNYETTDSGDGTNHAEGMECAVPYPMIAINLEHDELVIAADELRELLGDAGVPMGRHYADEDHEVRRVEATYSTHGKATLLLVCGVTDADLRGPLGGPYEKRLAGSTKALIDNGPIVPWEPVGQCSPDELPDTAPEGYPAPWTLHHRGNGHVDVMAGNGEQVAHVYLWNQDDPAILDAKVAAVNGTA